MLNSGGKPMTKEDEESFKNMFAVKTTSPTFSFNHDGKTYGPFNGSAENMLVLKSMTDGKPTEKFYGFGWQMVKVSEKQVNSQGVVKTENSVFHVKDYMMTTLMPTYPAGTMAFALGGQVNTFLMVKR